jgi:hypothetical protein
MAYRHAQRFYNQTLEADRFAAVQLKPLQDVDGVGHVSTFFPVFKHFSFIKNGHTRHVFSQFILTSIYPLDFSSLVKPMLSARRKAELLSRLNASIIL